MQDLAQEITALLEPPKPIGHRLLMFVGPATGDVIFEAKAVAYEECVTEEAVDGLLVDRGQMLSLIRCFDDGLFTGSRGKWRNSLSLASTRCRPTRFH